MAGNIDDFIPEIWSGALLAHLDTNLVLGQLVNRNYEGEVSAYGDTVKIFRPGYIGSSGYTAGTTTVTYPEPRVTDRSLVINERDYISFGLDDLQRVQARLDLINSYMERGGYALADSIDQSISAFYSDGDAGTVTLDLTSSPDFYAAAVEAGENLDMQNVPRNGRWLVVSPAGYGQLLQDSKFTQASALGDQVVQSGVVGRIAGFDIRMSNNLAGTGVTATLGSAAASGATSLTVSALSAGIPAGTRLVFGGGLYAVTSAAAATSATSISVNALDWAIPSGAVATYKTARRYLYGTNAAITHARQLTPTMEALRLEGSFSTGVRAEVAWGSKVVEPRSLGDINTTEV